MGVTTVFHPLLLRGNRRKHVTNLDYEPTLLEKHYHIHCKMEQVSFNLNNPMELPRQGFLPLRSLLLHVQTV